MTSDPNVTFDVVKSTTLMVTRRGRALMTADGLVVDPGVLRVEGRVSATNTTARVASGVAAPASVEDDVGGRTEEWA